VMHFTSFAVVHGSIDHFLEHGQKGKILIRATFEQRHVANLLGSFLAVHNKPNG
jgi:ribosomal protein L35AE/L33A